MSDFISGLRVAVATMAICVAGYAALILGFAQVLTPATANGSLVTNEHGKILGSRLIAQRFASQAYFWPRPSAVDYNAAGAGGSNLSPANQALTKRAKGLIAAYGGATERQPIPADLVTASGSGLDPNISLEGALVQVPRVAKARGVETSAVASVVQHLAYAPGAFFSDNRIVNVLELNLALDAELAAPAARD